ncbi:MAG: single-stranded-DNA-specific exonuclease RecJ [Neisseriaceae bacterium]
MIVLRKVDARIEAELIKEGYTALMARLLSARGLSSVREARLKFSLLPHFNLLKGIKETSQLLANALMDGKKIVVAADYDADGATACALAVRGVRAMGGKIDFVVPYREKEGYGLSPPVVDRAIEKNAEIILTVDNGIASIEGVAYAQSKGLTVVVTDHHLPGLTIPNCLIVNPNQAGCEFPCKNLAGVGVVFYVLLALRSELESRGYFKLKNRPKLSQWLDLVALGTVADVVKLDHVNRILVTHGLRLIQANRCNHGIQALFDAAKRPTAKAGAHDLGFAIGPRVNAAGRLEDITLSIRCLLAETYEEAYGYALELNVLNYQRRKKEVYMLERANESLSFALTPGQNSIVLFSEEFHQGVIGLVASRLKEKHYLPSIVFAKGVDGELKGSGRSISGLHLRDALDLVSKRAPKLILKFGGHAMAAGLSIQLRDLEKFRSLFEEVVRELIDPISLKKVFYTDGKLETEYLNLDAAKQLQQMVWGQGFEAPSFSDHFEIIKQFQVGRRREHLKAIVRKDQYEFEALIFYCNVMLPRWVKLVYRLVPYQWEEKEELQLYVEYWEKALDDNFCHPL